MCAATSVKVALRVRPLTVKETLDNANECLLHVPHSSQVVIGLPDSSQSQKSFTFDHLFSPETRQEDVYTNAVEPLITEFLKGFNATILAYGQVNYF